MSSINGIGSTYIGCSDVKKDGSYITTKWITFFIPIVPTASLRVLPVSHTNLGFYSSSKFEAQPVPFYWPHALKMYATYLVAALFICLSDRFTGPSFSHTVSSPFFSSVIAFVVSILAIGISGFIRKGSVFANLIVSAGIVTFSLLFAGNISVQPDKSWQYMYYFWAAYAIYFIVSLRKKKDAVRNQKRTR